MKKNLVFAGVMGAILMSAGANAATTSVATKGYVDQEIGKVNTTVTTISNTYVKQEDAITIDDVTGAINKAITDADLAQYQTVANKLTSIAGTLSAEDRANKYPTVGAVLDAINGMDLGLTTDDVEALQALLGSDGVVNQINSLKQTVDKLDGDANTAGSVAQQIASALGSDFPEDSNVAEQLDLKANISTTYTKDETDEKYQAKSTGVSIGNTGGAWLAVGATADAAKAALESGITAEKVTAYDALAGDGEGSLAELATTVAGLGTDLSTLETTVGGHTTNITNLTTVVGADADHGLQKTVADNASDIDDLVEVVGANDTDGLRGAVATNTASIATNAAEIAKKIEMPSECASGNKVCVLMTNNGAISWTPVTSPVDDPASGGAQEPVSGEPGSGL